MKTTKVQCNTPECEKSARWKCRQCGQMSCKAHGMGHVRYSCFCNPCWNNVERREEAAA